MMKMNITPRIIFKSKTSTLWELRDSILLNALVTSLECVRDPKLGIYGNET